MAARIECYLSSARIIQYSYPRWYGADESRDPDIIRLDLDPPLLRSVELHRVPPIATSPLVVVRWVVLNLPVAEIDGGAERPVQVLGPQTTKDNAPTKSAVLVNLQLVLMEHLLEFAIWVHGSSLRQRKQSLGLSIALGSAASHHVTTCQVAGSEKVPSSHAELELIDRASIVSLDTPTLFVGTSELVMD